MLEQYFNLKEHNTTVKTEVIAGFTTFVTMAYIIFVNPTMIAEGIAAGGVEYSAAYNGVFFATCISAFIGTMLMGLYAKIPFAQASGMGLNAFFTYTLMFGLQMTYGESLAVVAISGLLFIVITIFGLREAIVKAIPMNIKIAISGGIGLFLAFVGLQSSGLVVDNGATLVSLLNFAAFNDPAARPQIMSAILTLIGVVIIAALYKLNIKGAIIIGIVACTILGIPMGITHLPDSFSMSIGTQFKDFTDVSLFACFDGFKTLFEGQSFGTALWTVVTLVVSFSLVDMFDTIGTLLGTAKKADMLDEKGEMPRMRQALMCDAVATTAGAMLGTSTVTTFVESSSGIAEGGKTGLTSVVTATLFLLAIVFAPIIGIVPGAATAPALIVVGALMISGVKDINFDDMSESVPAFLTIAMMPLTYSIANGIGFGIISYVVIKALSRKFNEINLGAVIISIIFILRFFTVSM